MNAKNMERPSIVLRYTDLIIVLKSCYRELKNAKIP